MIGSSELHRLTTDPAPDFVPSWSPDGRRIAFRRLSATGVGTIHVVSALGGPDRKLLDWPARSRLSWSPDGRWLATTRSLTAAETTPEARGIFLLPVEGGEPRSLTRAQGDGVDVAPALSPDGRRLAYAACVTRVPPLPCDVHVLDLGPGLVPIGSPRRLTRQGFTILSIVWAEDGRSLVYDTQAGSILFHLWRVDSDGKRPAERLEVAGAGARAPAIAGSRLAFSRWFNNPDIIRFDPGRPRQTFLASSFFEGGSQFSPDGRRIAFESVRSGERMEIWLASGDGGNPVQLTRGPGRWQGSPTWSPDGRRIAFDSQAENGRWDIWTIDVDGGAPLRLTLHPGDENVPSWSRDGQWVYFGAQRDGQAGISRVPAGGGSEERVAALGPGTIAGRIRESEDRKTLFFGPGTRRAIFAHPLGGGRDAKVVDCVAGAWGFDVSGSGLYYAACGEGSDRPLHRLDLASGQNRRLGTAEKYWSAVTVSPDGRTILYTSQSRTGSDLMLVEGFR
jgi:Tol biopolymer transport system component